MTPEQAAETLRRVWYVDVGHRDRAMAALAVLVEHDKAATADAILFRTQLADERERNQRLEAAAKDARAIAAAPDYDEEAIKAALWRVVNLALDAEEQHRGSCRIFYAENVCTCGAEGAAE